MQSMTLRYIIIYSIYSPDHYDSPQFCCTFPQPDLVFDFFFFLLLFSPTYMYFVYDKLRIRKCCYVYINIEYVYLMLRAQETGQITQQKQLCSPTSITHPHNLPALTLILTHMYVYTVPYNYIYIYTHTYIGI